MTALTYAMRQQGSATTAFVEVVAPGAQTTVQDGAGRHGYWGVGVPPSGAWDDVSFGLAARAVGNDPSWAGLECVVVGPTLRFHERRLVCVTGAATAATLDGHPLRPGRVVMAEAGGLLEVGPLAGPGMRAYVAVAGGVDVPRDLGSRSTFLLGGFGGLDGRALEAGDHLPVGRVENCTAPGHVVDLLPLLGGVWDLRVVLGPHGAPDLLTEEGLDEILSRPWAVDHRADRTGVRLLGPTPRFARRDGGEAGMHPSNIHDSAYPVGGIMLSGDTPVIVGPDGPSLGGFMVPACVIGADLWKLAQMRPGDGVRLVPVSLDRASEIAAAQAEAVRTGHHSPTATATCPVPEQAVPAQPVSEQPGPGRTRWLDEVVPALGERVTVTAAGDRHLLVEAGAGGLDLRVRLWVHLLHTGLSDEPLPGVQELVPGVRSLLVGVRPGTRLESVETALAQRVRALPDPTDIQVPCREVTLPIAFDDPTVHDAMRRYDRVRPDAPWSPDNVEFIRRVNGIDTRDEVFDIVHDATYLVLGLGDVYLGAPVAVPIDPRHRVVTTKYNPARMWTPENAVGIGGVYLCIYGMEGPGGYQLVGRTVPVWRRVPGDDSPWLLRHFDRIRFRPVTSEELMRRRAAIRAGSESLDATPATFSLKEVESITAEHADEIERLGRRRRAAFEEEVARWSQS